jgi:ATP-dependent DNA ligase
VHRARAARSRPASGRERRPAAVALAPMLHRRGSDDDLARVGDDFLLSTLPDGWRCVAVLDAQVRLLSRSGIDLAPFVPRITERLAALAPGRGGGPTVLDGILILPGEAEQPAPGLGDVTGFAVLDAPCIAGTDLTTQPLAARQERLRALRWPRDGGVTFERAWRGDARASLAQLQSAGTLAGGTLLARRAASPYLPGRCTGAWLSFGERESAEMLLCGVAASGALVLGTVSPHGLLPGGVTWPTRRWRALAARCREGRAAFDGGTPWPSLGAIAWAEPDLWLALEPDVRAGSGRSGPRWRFLRVQEDISAPAPAGDRHGVAPPDPEAW